jgi:threonine aldolase
MKTYKSRAAREAEQSGYGSEAYWQYLDYHAQELAEKFPERAFYFMGRTLGEALAGNDGD